jgi:hypothetical protein
VNLVCERIEGKKHQQILSFVNIPVHLLRGFGTN